MFVRPFGQKFSHYPTKSYMLDNICILSLIKPKVKGFESTHDTNKYLEKYLDFRPIGVCEFEIDIYDMYSYSDTLCKISIILCVSDM